MKVTIEELIFPLCIKEKVLKIRSVSKLDIRFTDGKNIKYNNTNLAINEPHKIIIS